MMNKTEFKIELNIILEELERQQVRLEGLIREPTIETRAVVRMLEMKTEYSHNKIRIAVYKKVNEMINNGKEK